MNIWRDRLSRWLDPIARRIPLSPNAITLVALAINVGAAAALYFGGERPLLFLAAVFLFAIGGFADALDGIVARMRGTSSRYGDFLDHVADRVSDTAVAAGWLLGNDISAPLAVLAASLVMLNGYVGTQIEASYHERNYDSVGRGEFVLGLIVYPIASYILVTNGWSGLTYASLTIAEWMTILLIAFALLGIAQRFALAAKLERS